LRVGAGSNNSLLIENATMTNDVTHIAGVGHTVNNYIHMVNAGLVTRLMNIGTGWGDANNALYAQDSNIEITGTFDSGSDVDNNPNGTTVQLNDSVMKVGGIFGIGRNNGNSNNSRVFINQSPGRESRMEVGGDFELGGGRNNYVYVNYGTLKVGGAFWFGTHGGSYAYLIVTNGTVNVNGVVRYPEWGSGSDCRIELSGADAVLTASSIHMARFGHRNSMHLYGGSAKFVNGVTFGDPRSTGYGNSTTSRVVVKEPASRLEGATLTAQMSTTFEFAIPKGGFTDPADGAPRAPMYFSGTAELDADTMFEITAGEFTGRQVLLEAAGGITSDELDEEANFTVNIPKSHKCKIIQRPDHIAVLISQLPTVLIVR